MWGPTLKLCVVKRQLFCRRRVEIIVVELLVVVQGARRRFLVVEQDAVHIAVDPIVDVNHCFLLTQISLGDHIYR